MFDQFERLELQTKVYLLRQGRASLERRRDKARKQRKSTAALQARIQEITTQILTVEGRI